jgi:hypothetical protein
MSQYSWRRSTRPVSAYAKKQIGRESKFRDRSTQTLSYSRNVALPTESGGSALHGTIGLHAPKPTDPVARGWGETRYSACRGPSRT